MERPEKSENERIAELKKEIELIKTSESGRANRRYIEKLQEENTGLNIELSKEKGVVDGLRAEAGRGKELLSKILEDSECISPGLREQVNDFLKPNSPLC